MKQKAVGGVYRGKGVSCRARSTRVNKIKMRRSVLDIEGESTSNY